MAIKEIKKYGKILTIALLVFFYFSCSNKNNELDKSIILKIGKLEVTQYEFDRNKMRELVNNVSDSSALKNSKVLSEWEKEYKNKCIIIADAYNKRYDTISSIKNEIKNVGDFMMIQKYGYLWKKTISPIVDANKIVTEEKIEKRKKLYYFDYISSKDINDLLKIIKGDSVIHDRAEFLNIKSKNSNNKFITTGYFSMQWPFLSFWDYREYIYNMKEGSVSKLIQLENNYIYLYLDHIEEINITDKEKNILTTELQLGTEDELIKKEAVEIRAKCRPKLNLENIETIGEFLSNGHSITDFKDNIELIQYYIHDTLIKRNSNDFIKYYSNLVLRDDIKDKEMLKSYINDYYNDEYLINEAKRLKLYNTDIFLLDKNNYQNNVLYWKYLENEIFKNIKIDSNEVIKYYKTNLPIFKQPKYIVANMFMFDNSLDAMNNLNKIEDLIVKNEINKTIDVSNINSLSNYTPNVTIDLEAQKEYSKEIINALLESSSGKIIRQPIQYKNKYIVFTKQKEYGESIKSLNDVYKLIENKLKNEKSEIEKVVLINKLKTQYKFEIDKTSSI